MKKTILIISFILCSCFIFSQTRNLKLIKVPIENPTNQKRKAIVIGMSDYGLGKNLNNTLNDADDIADVLTRLGFQVTLLKNNDLRNLKANLTNWYSTIEGNDMAVFYFAGHGMEVNGTNYLIPIGVELNSQADVEYNALNVNQIVDNIDEKRVDMKLLILDACRDNPFKRSWTRSNSINGLAQMTAPHGTFIAFAASPGSVAQDGGSYNLRNGVFTHYLKQEIVKQGVSIDEIFNNVTRNVSSLTKRQQTPFRNSSLAGNFYFKPFYGYDKPNPTPVPNVILATEIVLNKYSTQLNVGNSEKLVAQISPSNATNKSIMWSSSNSNLAAVDSYGQITAISAGTVQIVAKTIDGEKKAVCTITISSKNGGQGYVNLEQAMIAVQTENIIKKKVDWQTAKKLCEGSRLGGYTNWRLPTIEELNIMANSIDIIDTENFTKDLVIEYQKHDNLDGSYWSNTYSHKEEVKDKAGKKAKLKYYYYYWYMLIFRTGHDDHRKVSATPYTTMESLDNLCRCVRYLH